MKTSRFDPFHYSTIAAATPVPWLAYGAFDGVTPRAEDVANLRHRVLWPDYTTFPNLAPARVDGSPLVGRPPRFHAMPGTRIAADPELAFTAPAGGLRCLFCPGIRRSQAAVEIGGAAWFIRDDADITRGL